MIGAEFCDISLWWIFPVVMIILCFFMMRGKSGFTMCGLSPHNQDSHFISDSNSAMEILKKRYALGEMDKEEYEEKKKELSQSG